MHFMIERLLKEGTTIEMTQHEAFGTAMYDLCTQMKSSAETTINDEVNHFDLTEYEDEDELLYDIALQVKRGMSGRSYLSHSWAKLFDKLSIDYTTGMHP